MIDLSIGDRWRWHAIQLCVAVWLIPLFGYDLFPIFLFLFLFFFFVLINRRKKKPIGRRKERKGGSRAGEEGQAGRWLRKIGFFGGFSAGNWFLCSLEWCNSCLRCYYWAKLLLWATTLIWFNSCVTI